MADVTTLSNQIEETATGVFHAAEEEEEKQQRQQQKTQIKNQQYTPFDSSGNDASSISTKQGMDDAAVPHEADGIVLPETMAKEETVMKDRSNNKPRRGSGSSSGGGAAAGAEGDKKKKKKTRRASSSSHHRRKSSFAGERIGLKVLVIGNCKSGKSSLIRHILGESFKENYKTTIGAEYYSKDLVIEPRSCNNNNNNNAASNEEERNEQNANENKQQQPRFGKEATAAAEAAVQGGKGPEETKPEMEDNQRVGASVSSSSTSSSSSNRRHKSSSSSLHLRLKLWDIAGQDRFAKLTRVYFSGAHGAVVVSDITRPGTLHAAADWKRELDECTPGLPVIFLANKSDLFESVQDAFETGAKMKEMETECGFRGTFITSCKTGKNVDKAIRFLSGQMVADLIRIKRKKAKAKAEAAAGGGEGTKKGGKKKKKKKEKKKKGVSAADNNCSGVGGRKKGKKDGKGGGASAAKEAAKKMMMGGSDGCSPPSSSSSSSSVSSPKYLDDLSEKDLIPMTQYRRRQIDGVVNLRMGLRKAKGEDKAYSMC